MLKNTRLRKMTAVMAIAIMVVTAFPVHASARRLANCDVCGVGLMVEESSNTTDKDYNGVTRKCIHFVYGLDHQKQWTSQRKIKCNNCGFTLWDPVVNHYEWECQGYDNPGSKS